MSGIEAELSTVEILDLEGLRTYWRGRFGVPPPLRSVSLLRYLIAWRLQAAVHGGLDRDLRRQLARTGKVAVEGQHLGIGAKLSREWQGRRVEVVVVEGGFTWNDTTYRSLSAAATAIAGTRWNGPRFFGLRTS